MCGDRRVPVGENTRASKCHQCCLLAAAIAALASWSRRLSKRVRLCDTSERRYVSARAKPVDVFRPPLHHRSPFGQQVRVVIRGADRVSLHVRQPLLDHVRRDAHQIWAADYAIPGFMVLLRPLVASITPLCALEWRDVAALGWLARDRARRFPGRSARGCPQRHVSALSHEPKTRWDAASTLAYGLLTSFFRSGSRSRAARLLLCGRGNSSRFSERDSWA